MLKLRINWTVPNGGWRYPRFPERPVVDPSKDLIFGGDLPDLFKRVTEFRVSNNLDVVDIEARVMDYLCRVTNSDCVPAAQRKKGLRARGADVARFLYAMTMWMVKGGFVPQEEAEDRAETCASCEHNQPADDAGCLGCFGLASRVMTIIGDRRTRVDSALNFCNICGCSCAVQAFVPMEVLARVHKLEEFPPHCWKRKWVEAQKADAPQ